MTSSREIKNKKIAESNRQTRIRRQSQVPLNFELGVRNEKRNRKTGCFRHLKMICVEAKWMRNMITSILNEGTKKISNLKDKDFKSVIHKDKDGNVIVSELKYLKSSLRLGVLTQYKWNLASLKAAKNKGRKVGRIKFESEHKTVMFLQHGITHQISGPNSIRIQGFEHDIRVSGLKQLRELEKYGIDYEIATLNLHMVCDDCFKFFITVYADREQYEAFKSQKKKVRVEKRISEQNKKTHDTNAFDFGCIDTTVDAYGEKHNIQFEETKRLKRLQQQIARQRRAAEEKSDDNSAGKKKKKGKTKFSNSVRRYDAIQRMKKEYYKISRRKDAAAISLVNEILDMNETVIFQNDQFSRWKKQRKFKAKNGKQYKRRGSGRTVQRGILGRIKKRLKASSQTHVINEWVPTTKLCTHCGRIH